MPADLHCHSRMSDGSLGIEDLISLAKRNGMSAIAITDHDTMSGTVRAGVLCARYGIIHLPAVEMSGFDPKRKRKVHLLCYLPEKPNRLEGILYKSNEARKKSGIEMARLVMEKFPILPEHITKYAAGSKAVYKQHIMHALMDFGYTDAIFSDLYKELFDEDTGSCHVETPYPQMTDIAKMIRLAGGLCVLAHPKVFDSLEAAEELAKAGLLDGIEAWSPKNGEQFTSDSLSLCNTYGLIPTGGSDFHGLYNSAQAPLGSFTTPEDSLAALFAKKGLPLPSPEAEEA